ncbi:hypothetical protein [Rhodococcus sp. NPDC127528]|uniref:hypothetical protein n=1 Tax=unclassified Rhodococcus (in: high G+C Gram-positive bacteria) TaxID=192944 RepID=UPI003632C52B
MSASPAQYRPVAAAPVAQANVSQATAIEQSRAVAEVQAAVLVAQQNRRSKPFAIAEMHEVCEQKSVADRAFFKFPRSEGTVSGPSIHLARELARCWGNIQFGVTELRRDDDKAESEMQAYAWDLETNARNSTTFIVPHKRDTKKGVRQLTDMRDIYENNANNGARRLREAIFSVLPGWFIEEAQERCRATLQDGGGVPLPTRIANSIAWFKQIGVTQEQLEQKVGRPSSEWTEHDVTELGITFTSIKNGELTKEQEFGAQRATVAIEPASAAETPAEPQPKQPEPEPAAEEAPAEPAAPEAEQDPPAEPEAPAETVKLATTADLRKLDGALRAARIGDLEERRAFLSARVRRELASSKEMTRDEVAATVRFLETGEKPVEASEAQA